MRSLKARLGLGVAVLSLACLRCADGLGGDDDASGSGNVGNFAGASGAGGSLSAGPGGGSSNSGGSGGTAPVVVPPEVEIGDPKPSPKSTASIYSFHGPTELPLKPHGEWNAYSIVCTGKRYRVHVNGKLVTDWNDTADRPLKGYVGIQNFPWPGAVRHRNVRIKELP